LKVLRPNWDFSGTSVRIRTNSLGLRSPEITAHRLPNSLRIAIVGASTLMGVETAANEETFHALLEAKLRSQLPGRIVEVINAGIAGYTLHDERLLLERLILPLRPDLVIVYPGVNDFRTYCEGSPGFKGARSHGLPLLSLPDWLLSVRATLEIAAELGLPSRYTVRLRDPYSVDVRPYRSELEALASGVLQTGGLLVLATNAKAFRREQPLEEQERLLGAARLFTPCFDVTGLNILYDRHNDVIREVGKAMRVPVLALDERIPGGTHHFGSSPYLSHLSPAGEQRVADEILRFLTTLNLFP
jgi:hypothetical protein